MKKNEKLEMNGVERAKWKLKLTSFMLDGDLTRKEAHSLGKFMESLWSDLRL